MPPKPNPTSTTTMPGLTVDTTSPQSNHTRDHDPNSPSHSQRSASPVRPPYSPITPTLASARLATSATPSNNTSPAQNQNQNANQQPSKKVYTHTQPPQSAINQPKPIEISFDENPDALALKSAISILQMQKRNAERDIRELARMKKRAVEDPGGFVGALGRGEVRGRGDGLFDAGNGDSSDSEDEAMPDSETKTAGKQVDEEEKKEEGKWGTLPTPQNVVRCPPINWSQYAVIGDSLNKLHDDQRRKPTGGEPARVGAGGSLVAGGEGVRRVEVGVAAPYMPGRDKIEKDKVGTRKGGKR